MPPILKWLDGLTDNACPTCGQWSAPVTIDGQKYTVAKRTNTKKRYIQVGDDEVLFVRPVPVLIVRRRKP